MSASTMYYLLFASLAILFSTGSCIECYVCFTNTSNSSCWDPKADKLLKPQLCNVDTMNRLATELQSQRFAQFSEHFRIDHRGYPPDSPMVCQKIDVHEKSYSYIIRGCQLSSGDPCGNLKNHKEVVCNNCNTDGCNGGPATSIPLSLISLIITVMGFMFLTKLCA